MSAAIEGYSKNFCSERQWFYFWSVGQHMKGDYCQETSGRQRCCANQGGRRMSGQNFECLSSGLPQFSVRGPQVKNRTKPCHQNDQGQSYQQSPQTNARSCGVPIDYLLGGVCWLILKGLEVTNKKRGHEERGWKD